MNKVIPIVLSKFDEIFTVFIRSYMDNISSPLLVIDDGLSDQIKSKYNGEDVSFVASPKPFGFTKSVNMGIKLAGNADVLIFNDDCFIHTTGLDTKLSEIANADDSIALVVPMMTNTMNTHQRPATQIVEQEVHKGLFYAISPSAVSFTCFYLKRAVIDHIGMIDEGFVGWGREDADYSGMVQTAGYKLAICYSCFVEHGGPKFGATISNSRRRLGECRTDPRNVEYYKLKNGV